MFLWLSKCKALTEFCNEGNVMVKVSIKDEYDDILNIFGDLHYSIDLALKRYLIEKIVSKIDELKKRDKMYTRKYGMDYLVFYKNINNDELFIHTLENDISKTWEIDMNDWEFSYKGIVDWTKKLESILLA